VTYAIAHLGGVLVEETPPPRVSRVGFWTIGNPEINTKRYQAAAPAEMSTPNLHRAKIRSTKSADRRMGGGPGPKTKNPREERGKTDLTLTGLLMKGVRCLAFYFGACAGGFSLVGGTIPLSRK
jgi:hypothetical protein